MEQPLDQGFDIDTIYFDFQKTFDKVSHKRLVQKLQAYGINDKLINWIQAFLIGEALQMLAMIKNRSSIWMELH